MLCVTPAALLFLDHTAPTVVLVMVVIAATSIGTVAFWRRRRWGAIVLLVQSLLGLIETGILALSLLGGPSNPPQPVRPGAGLSVMGSWMFVVGLGMMSLSCLHLYRHADTFLKQESARKGAAHCREPLHAVPRHADESSTTPNSMAPP